MLFNSYEFILLFLPVTWIGFFCIARLSHQLAAFWLAVASVVFYGWWNPNFVLLLLLSIAFNYVMGFVIGKAKNASNSRSLLIIAIAINLGLLGYFKYVNFFISTLNEISGQRLVLVDVVLPLGISFFTFTQIAFIVDVYRGIAKEYRFVHYLLFVTYFPHLIAGPVLHHKQMMPQFGTAKTYRPNPGLAAIGTVVFTIGLAKKVLLADNFAEYSMLVFDMATNGVAPDFIAAWIGALSYTLQLYFDFSGYTDMAIGLSLLFGITLPQNFNSPYKAQNIIEFWRRWHMTLSRFLKDYLYIPLGGNRHSPFRTHINILLTMLLGGLWHGANWTFVVWGGVHGCYLIVNHAWNAAMNLYGFGNKGILGSRIIGTALTFLAVVVAWVIFRSDSIASAQIMLEAMSSPSGIWPYFFGKKAGLLFAIGIIIVFLLPNSQSIGIWFRDSALAKQAPVGILSGVVCGLGFAVAFMALQKKSEFLYFQF